MSENLKSIENQVTNILNFTVEMHRGNLSEETYYREKDYTKYSASVIKNNIQLIKKYSERAEEPQAVVSDFIQSALSTTYAAENILRCLQKKEMRKLHAREAFDCFVSICNKAKAEHDLISVDVEEKITAAAKGTAIKPEVSEGIVCKLDKLNSEELKDYLEARFTSDMSWDNYGSYWQIDHIRPCASFDLTDPIQFKQACHYTNLQPLWWFENISKSDNY